MTDPVARDPPGLADDQDEDTAELLLSPQELNSLSRAAADAHSAPLPVDPIDVPPCGSRSQFEPRVSPARGLLKLQWPRVPFEVATLVVVVAMALASGVHRRANTPDGKKLDHRVATSLSTHTNNDTELQPAGEPAGEPVRLQNPFDSSEVFQFPPGTSAAAAREAVANLLLERGRARVERLRRKP